jgi:hypothetical protein
VSSFILVCEPVVLIREIQDPLTRLSVSYVLGCAPDALRLLSVSLGAWFVGFGVIVRHAPLTQNAQPKPAQRVFLRPLARARRKAKWRLEKR